MNHTWQNNTCNRCGIKRRRHTYKLLMAIDHGRDYYKYETGWKYEHLNGNETSERPDCINAESENEKCSFCGWRKKGHRNGCCYHYSDQSEDYFYTDRFFQSEVMTKGAHFSEDRKFRYSLYRIWDSTKPKAMCIGLNPSTANEEKNDATINRLIGALKQLGFGGFVMTNLFALISKKPEALRSTPDPVKENDKWLTYISKSVDQIIFCWGNFPMAAYRAKKIKVMFPKAKCFGKNANGTPWHPRALGYAGIKNTDVQLINY